jgi:hypothetical protein
MTRALQKRLALAIEAIDPNIHSDILKRKRPTSSSNEAFSDSASSISDPQYVRLGMDSSPSGPMFSDELARSGSSRSSKRAKYRSVSSIHTSTTQPVRPHRNAHSQSWKRTHKLPMSSPAMRGQPTLSFVTEVSAAADDSQSEEDDDDLPLHSFQIDARQIQSSPPRYPRTPSPSLAGSGRVRNKAFNQTSRQDDAADLLMLLATSPSPAINKKNSNSHTVTMQAPSTPPQKTPLPSSMLNTPGGGSNYVGLGAATPGFNFSDFLNVTPSPAQAAWKTPGGVAKTPNATRQATRRLNFDSLVPPTNPVVTISTSIDLPTLQVSTNKSSVTGLGMDLGGELISSQ